MKRRAYVYIMMLFAVMLFASPCCSKQSYAKSAEKISKVRIVICKEEKETLMLLKASGNVKWTSSDKRIVKIAKRKGKRNQTVVLETRNPGKAIVQAKAGNKIYRCKVIVQNKVSKASLAGVEQTDNTLRVRVRLGNNGREPLNYGCSFWVEKLENGKWVKLTAQNDVAFTLAQRRLKGRRSVEETYELYSEGKAALYQKSDFLPGTYRIHVDADFAKDDYNYVAFQVK